MKREKKTENGKVRFIPEKLKVSFWDRINTRIKEEGIFNISVLIISTFLFLFFSFSHLGKHVYTDEPVLWYPWIEQFGQALKSFNFSEIKTPYNYPGLPVIALGSILTAGKNITEVPAEEFHNYLFLMKSPIVAFNFISLFLIYFLSSKLWNKKIAILTTVLIALHPLIIAFSQHTQGDTTLWNTFFITITSFFIYVKSGKSRYIFITALFFAITVLSKFFGLILYPLLFIFLYFEYLFMKISKEEFVKYIKGLLGIYVLLPVFVFIIYPVCWHNPYLALKTTYLNSEINIINPLFPIIAIALIAEVVFFKGVISKYLRNKKFLNTVFYSIISLFFGILIYGIVSKYTNIFEGKGQVYFGGVKVKDYITTINQFAETLNYIIPWYIFIGIFAVFIHILYKKNNLEGKNFIIYMLLTIFSFAAAAIVGNFQIWGKYLLFLLPLIYLGFALVFTNSFKNQKILIVLIAAIAVIEIITVYPTYFSYNNNFLPLQNRNVYNGNYGGFELAEQINKVDGSDTLNILSDTFGFLYYFKGNSGLVNRETSEKKLNEYDYAFLSSFGKREKTAWNMVPYSLRLLYEQPLDSAEFHLGDKNQFVKLVKIPKQKYKFVPKGYFDTDFYINFKKNRCISFWVKPSYLDTLSSILKLAYAKNDYLSINSYKNIINTTYNRKKILYTNISTKNMIHIVWMNYKTKKGCERVLFINGIMADKKAHCYLGKYIKGIFINTNYNGEIRDVRVYDKVLSNNEILAIYNLGEITNEEILTANNNKFAPVRHYTIK